MVNERRGGRIVRLVIAVQKHHLHRLGTAALMDGDRSLGAFFAPQQSFITVKAVEGNIKWIDRGDRADHE